MLKVKNRNQNRYFKGNGKLSKNGGETQILKEEEKKDPVTWMKRQ